MNSVVRNRLIGLGALWGLCLAAIPAFIMANPLRPDGFLVAAVLCALVSGVVGTFVAGRRATVRTRKAGRNKMIAGFGTGLFQGLVGGGLAALIIWGIMAFLISGFTIGGTADLSSLMRPQVFLGSFFVSLSVFLYALVGGLLLGPVFGILVNRVAGAGANAGAKAGVKGKGEPR